MKKLLLSVACVIALMSTYTSCKKDSVESPKEQKGTLMFKVSPNVSGAVFNMGNRYTTLDNQSYDINEMSFYIGDIYLVAQDNSLVPLKDIVYVDLNSQLTPPYDPKTVGTQFPFTVKVGEYKAIQYGLGVPPKLNGIADKTFNPAQYPSDHPLSSYRGTAWAWAGYLFTMFSGNSYDNKGNALTMEYHVTTDTFYTPVTNPVTIKISDNDTTTLVMNLDINKIFYLGAGEKTNVNQQKESFTHSQGVQQDAVASKIIYNLSKALTPIQ